MQFHDPYFLLLLIVIPLLVWRHVRCARDGQGSIVFSSIAQLKAIGTSWTVYARHALFGINLIALALAIIALARPQKGMTVEEVSSEGIDIMIALDASSSMEAQDFQPHNRFFVAKTAAENFIEGLRHDRAGLVVFAAQSITFCPLTLDYAVLKNVLKNVELGAIEDGTAIGSALAVCLNRLRQSAAKSKAIILITDGVNNRGEIQPMDAAKIAQTMRVKIYAIGVGTTGIAKAPIDHPVYGKIFTDQQMEIDEASLREIAGMTKGMYYRATDRLSLEKIFEEIGRLEKSKIKEKSYNHYDERFPDFLFPALALIFISTLAGFSRFSKIP